MTAPSIQAGYTSGADTSNTTTTHVTAPTNAAGDVIYIAIVSDAAGQTFTAPTGFSTLYSNVNIPSTSPTATFAVFYKTSTGSEAGPFDVGLGTSERQSWVAWTVHDDNGFDVTGTVNTGSTGTGASVNFVTTDQADCLIIGIIATDGATTPHTPASMTKLAESAGSSAGSISVHYEAAVSLGTWPSSSSVTINTSEQWAGVAFAIKGSPVGRTGTLGSTLADVTVSGAGNVPRTGSGSNTLDAVTVSGAGNVPIVGTGSNTLAAATLSATGTSASTRTGSGASTLADVTASAAGNVPRTGSGASTLADVTASAAGNVPRTGSASNTLEAATLAATGALPRVINAPSIRGYAKGADTGNTNLSLVVLPPDQFDDGNTIWIAIVSDAGSQVFTAPTGFNTLYSNIDVSGSTATFALFYKKNIVKANESFDGTDYDFFVSNSISERQSWVIFATSGDGTIDVQGITATGSSTAGSIPALTTTSNKDLVFGIIATDGATTPHTSSSDYTKLDESAGISAGSISVWSKTKDTAGAIAAATVNITNEQWVGVSFALSPVLTGSVSSTLADVTVSAVGSQAIRGSAANTLDPVTTSSSGTVPRTGSAAITIDDATVTSYPPRTGDLSSTLAAATLSATGIRAGIRTGTLSSTLGTLTGSAAGSLGVDLPAPTIRGSSSGYDTGNTTVTPVYLPTFQDGDALYIALVSDAASQTFGNPYSITYGDVGLVKLYDNVAIPTASPQATFALYYRQNARLADFPYDTQLEQYYVNVPVTIPERQAYLAIAVVSDGGPDEQGVNATGSSASATIPAITTDKNNSLIIGIIATDGSSPPHSSAGGYTQVTEVSGSSAGSLSLWSHVLGTAGTYGADTVTITSEQWLGVSFSIQPTLPGRVNATLGDLTVAGAGVVPVKASADITLGELTSSSSGGIPVIGGSAVINFESVSAPVSSSTSPLTISTPSVTAGKLMIMHIGHSNARATTYPSGWELVTTSGSGAQVNRIDILQRIATSSEPASYDIAWTGSDTVSASILVVNNDANAPMRVVDSAVNITTDGTRVWPNVNLYYANGFLACFGTLGINSGTTPTVNFNERYDVGATVRMYLQTEPLSGVQSTGTITATGGGAGTGRYASVLIATGGAVESNSITLAPLTLTSLPPRTGSGSNTLAALTANGSGMVLGGHVGNLNTTLGSLSVSGHGQVVTPARPSTDISGEIAAPPLASIFTVNIENAAGVKLGAGPIATGTKWTYKQKLSAAGEWALEVPLAEPRLSNATLKRRVHCYVRRSGQLVWLGGGIIESRSYTLSADNVPVMNLSGPDLLRELAGITVAFEVNALDTAPLTHNILEQIFAAIPAWSATEPVSLPEITARFVHESVLNALISVCEKTGAFFWMEPYTVTPRKIIIATAPVVSSIVATNMADSLAAERNQNLCLISNIERTEASWDAYNRLIVYGAGDGQARLTLATANVWPDGSPVQHAYLFTDPYGRDHNFVLDKTTNTITDTLAVTEYGTIEQAAAFKDIAPITPNDADMIAAANTLVVAAVNQLVLSSFPTESYRLSVAALRAVVHPGMQIRVMARKYRDGLPYINIDTNLIIQEVDYEIDEQGEKVTGLTVATTWKPEKTGATILSEQIQKLNSLEAHPQIGANENTISYREDVDDDYSASFPFWLSLGTVQINSVTLRFKLEQLRSSVKTIGGTATGTVNVPAHSHTLSSHNHEVPHQHYIVADPGAGGSDIQIFSGGGSPDYGSLVGNGLGHQVRVSTNTDSTVTSDGNSTITVSGGGTAGVSVDISNAITAVYGVFVDPNVAYTVDELEWTVNGIFITTVPTSLGSGWYELDITPSIIDTATLRPSAYSNTVEVAVKTASKASKKVRVTCQVEIRSTITTIQATGSSSDFTTGGIRTA